MIINLLHQISFYTKRIERSFFLGCLIGSIPASIALIFLSMVYLGAWGKLPTTNELSNIDHDEASIVYASDNEVLGQYHYVNRQEANFSQLPDHLLDALIATEDVRFYNHDGVDCFSLTRVFFKSILLGDRTSGGGSTISQQLVKNLYPREDHGTASILINKTKEMILASRLEDIYSKKKILTLYLNTVPFGDNTYGVESASRRFFSKSVKDITVEESAVLIGMLKATHLYNPRIFPENSVARRNTVLSQMMKYDYISQEEFDTLSNTPIQLNISSFSPSGGHATYFREEVKKQVKDWLKAYNYANGTSYNLYTSGLKIYTTLDYDMQLMAEEAVAEHMKLLQNSYDKQFNNYLLSPTNKSFKEVIRNSKPYKNLKKQGLNDKEIFKELNKKQVVELWDWNGKRETEASIIEKIAHYQKLLNTGMLSMNPKNGAVKTWVGGINHSYYKFDHVAQSKRQVGSTFKPIVYASALEQGISPCKYYNPQSVKYRDHEDWWSPSNSGEGQDKFYTMRGALANSVNTVAVKVLREAGLNNVVKMANDVGLEDIPKVPSLALGTAQLNLLELAQAYTVFLNEGKAVSPFMIRTIKDSKGRVLADFSPKISSNRVVSNTTQEIMIEMLKGVVNQGTAGRLRWKYGLKNDIAGKTGTTQDNKDGWFVGLTPNLVTVTWVGPDNYNLGFESTRLGQGANTALPIFALLQQKMNENKKFDTYTKAKFKKPSLFTQEELGCPAETTWAYMEPAQKKTERLEHSLSLKFNGINSQPKLLPKDQKVAIELNAKSTTGTLNN